MTRTCLVCVDTQQVMRDMQASLVSVRQAKEQSDRQIQELRKHEGEHNAAMASKERQYSALQVKLQSSMYYCLS
jgi:hypothetical protein